MWVIILRYLRDKWKTIVTYCVAGFGFMWIYVAMFPSIQAQSESYAKLTESFPKAFMKAFGIESLNLDHIENFLSIEHFSMVWPIMAILLVTSLAASAIAKDIENGTMELSLARPIKRLSIFFGRYITGLIAIVVFVITSIFAIVPLAALHNVSYMFSHFVTTAILAALFCWAMFSLGMMFSAFFSDKGKVSMSMGGLLILMYVINIISGLKESLQNLEYLSFFHYFTAENTLVHNTLKPEAVWVFIGIAVACTAVGAWRFSKRDIAV